VGVASKSGWVDQDIFMKWFAHFVKYAKPSVEQPHLLLLDGHISHKSLALIDMAREHGVIIIIFPPHTTYKLQPLDRVMYCPLKTFYNQECDKWLVNHPGKRITDYDIASLFSAAYMRSATMEKKLLDSLVQGCILTTQMSSTTVTLLLQRLQKDPFQLAK